MSTGPRHLIMVSDAPATCGVEAFARLAAERFGARAASPVLGFAPIELRRALGMADSLVFNFPVVAWKKKLAEPLLAALAARTMGKAVVVVLHEWADLDWKRRMALLPVCLLATAILFSAPEIATQFAASRLTKAATGRRGLIPIPPNVIPSGQAARSPISEALRGQRRMGRLILGQFGSIYPKKQSARLLDVAARLIDAGRDVFVVFVGSFIKGQDSVEADFHRQAEELGVRDRVLVTGYIDDPATLCGVFAEIDAFAYAFPEGLSVRRASVLTAALSRKPVVVNAPPSRERLDQHPLLAALIDDRSLVLVPGDPDPDALARAVLASVAARRRGQVKPEAAIAALWTKVVEVIDDAAGDGSDATADTRRRPREIATSAGRSPSPLAGEDRGEGAPTSQPAP